MKKSLFFALAAAFAVSFTACNNAAKTEGGENAAEQPTEQTAEPAEAAPAAGSLDQAINDYDKVVDEYIVLFDKVKAGDAAAIQESQSLMSKVTEVSQTLSAKASEMTPEQAQKLADISKKFQDAAMKK